MASRLGEQRQVSPAFDFDVADDLSFAQAQITIPYDPARLNGFDPANLRIYHLDDKYGLWVPASDDQTVDTMAKTVTATVDHFSTFTVIALDPGGGWESYWDTKPVWCVPSTGGPTSNLDVAFVIDTSGSMGNSDPTRLRVAAAKLFVDAMRQSDRAAVVGFSSFATTYLSLTSLDTSENVALIKSKLDLTGVASGGTDITDAVNTGRAVLMAGATAGRPRIAILLTDGLSGYDPAATAAALADNVVVYTIGLGAGVDAELLQGIADGTGGRYLHLDQASQLPPIYAELASDLVDPGTDTDSDGLTDCIERRGALVSPGVYAPDAPEIFAGRYITTDPNDADTDDGGLTDGQELGPALDLRNDPDIAAEYSFLIDAGITQVWNPLADPRRADSEGDALNDYAEVQLMNIGVDVHPLRWDDFDEDQGYDIPLNLPASTLFVPDNNPVPDWPGQIVVWDHDTHICVTYCEAVYEWRQAAYELGGGYDWAHAIWCSITGCTPQDLERGLIETVVDLQGWFTRDGKLRDEWVVGQLTQLCWEVKEVPSADCVPELIAQVAEPIDQYSQIDEVTELIEILASLPGGTRPPLNAEQQAAKTRVEQLGRQACSEITQGLNESAQSWGRRVHTRFNELINAERATNPKFFGETGYLDGGVVEKVGNAWPAGTSAPDAVYGASQLEPEILFDLKTGVKGLIEKWLSRLSINLPAAFSNVPVFKVTC